MTILVASLPVIYMQYYMQKENLQTIYNVSEGITGNIKLEKFLQLLRGRNVIQIKKLRNKSLFK